MMQKHILIALMCLAIYLPSFTQGSKATVKVETAAKPYKLITSGTNVTIRSTTAIKSILVWTAEGKRIVEEKEINATNYNFRLTANARYFFIRIQMKDGKSFSEKIGTRQS